jgi:hypothetical protein
MRDENYDQENGSQRNYDPVKSRRQRKREIRNKIKQVIFIASLLIAVVGAVFLFTAPSDSETEDSKTLQAELSANSEYLATENAKSVSATSSVTSQSSEDSESSVPVLTAVGDSVMLGAAPEILKAFPGSYIDAKESRQVWDAPDILKKIKKKGRMTDTVVIALGMNGYFTKETGQEVIDAAGDSKVYWVIPYGQGISWLDDELTVLQTLAGKNDNLTLLDWPSVAEGHTEWFYDDGIHLNEEGQEAYAQFLLTSIAG